MRDMAAIFTSQEGHLYIHDAVKDLSWDVTDRALLGSGMADMLAVAEGNWVGKRFEMPTGVGFFQVAKYTDGDGFARDNRFIIYYGQTTWKADAYLGILSKAVVAEAQVRTQVIDRIPPGHWFTDDGCATFDEKGIGRPDSRCDGDFVEHHKLSDGLMDAQREQDKVWTTPVADGSAYYFVHSIRPLVLAHMPFLDGYRALPALLRGLTTEEVEADLAHNRRIQEFIAERQRKSLPGYMGRQLSWTPRAPAHAGPS